MSPNNHNRDRAIQQDARAWVALTGTNYTAARRQVTSPYAQGLLGERVSARDLIAVLDRHPLVGADEDGPLLGENGLYDDKPWQFDGKNDLVELALVIDMLRMFSPVPAADAEVGSYSLKHTAEKLLAPHLNYVSNGRLIWAAAALGLDLAADDDGGPNLRVGISAREHHYVRQMVDAGGLAPRGDQHRPTGLTHLLDALERCAAGDPPAQRWVRPAPVAIAAPFHDWLLAQADRNDPVGDFAADYRAGVHDSDHQIARNPSQLLSILHSVSPSPGAYDAGVAAIVEWFAAHPDANPVRTKVINSDVREVGTGERTGDMEVFRYICPCGDGAIIEEHDNIPGFQSHDVRLSCEKCDEQWDLQTPRGIRQWGLVPKVAARA